MVIDWTGRPSRKYVVRAYSRNRIHSMATAVRHANVLPGQPIYVYAYPRSHGGPVTNPTRRIMGTVLRPDGRTEVFTLNDLGRRGRRGDDIDKDGIFTGVYRNTKIQGPYQFLLRAEVDRWRPSEESSKPDLRIRSPRFVREARVSAAVGNPKDVERDPDDDVPDKPNER
jgi:hypothetical protein